MSYDAQLIAEGLCPDLVWIDTEDGRVDGRCEGPIVTVVVDGEEVAFACEGHTQERLGWMSMSEADKAAWERQRDEDGPY